MGNAKGYYRKRREAEVSHDFEPSQRITRLSDTIKIVGENNAKDAAVTAAKRDLLTLRYDIDDAVNHLQDRDDIGARRNSRKIVIARDAIKNLARNNKADREGNALDMATIASLRMEGKYIWEIADILGVSQPQINTALANVRDLWLQSSVMDFNDRKAEEIAKIDYMERKQWETIRLINNDAVMREEDGGMTELGFRRIKHAQDTIMWCIQMRTKIFGLEAPIKVDWRFEAKKYGIDADLMYHTLVAQFADQIIDAETVTFKELPAPKDYEGEDDESESDEGDYANTDSD